MGSFAILRRCAGMMRSRRISVEGANSGYPFHFSRESDANRMMSTAPAAPWLILPPAVDGSGKMTYKFHCLASNKDHIHTNEIDGELDLPPDIDIVKDVKFVGSSHGWLALHNRRNSDLFLSNPITDRHVKLPPLRAADRVILSSSLTEEEEEEEEEPLAFAVAFDSRGGIGLCSPRRRGKEWTLFGGDHAYDNLVYSTTHKRLFCVCSENGKKSIRLEGWSVDHDPPTLDWVIRRNKELDLDNPNHRWPGRRWEFKENCFQMKYLVCDEHSGEVFLIVRHVNRQAGPFGSIVNKVILSRYRGIHYIRTPYKTADFDVYKLDFQRGDVIHMRDSLEGLAMFVGINHSFAINPPAPGVKPDSIYFTDDNRLVEATRLERTTYGGHDNGIFDYQNKEFSPCCDFYPVEYDKIRKILPLPLWFTPTTGIYSK